MENRQATIIMKRVKFEVLAIFEISFCLGAYHLPLATNSLAIFIAISLSYKGDLELETWNISLIAMIVWHGDYKICYK
jgi:hypothetical protein